MELFWAMVRAFVVGGALCALGELLILRTNLTSARILVLFVIAGVALGALGIYEPLIEFAAASTAPRCSRTLSTPQHPLPWPRCRPTARPSALPRARP